jgi:hypothetical protein
MTDNFNQQKTESDLLFLKKLIEFAKENNWRVVVSGGYGMDFFLNKITRSHNDLDVIVYGKENRVSVIKKLDRFIIGYFPKAKFLTKQETFYIEFDVKNPNFGANIYFVETEEDPFSNLNKVSKLDGEIVINTEDNFPKPVKGKLGDLEVEVQDQNAHLADILVKHGDDKSPSKYDQDIINLRQVTDSKKVELLLKKSI